MKKFPNKNVLSFALNVGKPAIMPSPFISNQRSKKAKKKINKIMPDLRLL